MPKPEVTSTQEPNLVIPLATSYQPRDIAGYTTTVTNAVDQRKINCIYEPVQNGLTDTTTLYLAKRPGVTTADTYGVDGQVSHIFEVAAGATNSGIANRWVFSTSSNDIRVSDNSSTTVIATAAGYNPVYIDKGIFQGSDTVILQLRNASGTQRAFYSTTIGTWTEISDSDFTNLAHRGKMEFLPGRGFIMSGSRIYNSDLDALATWSATSFLTKQVTQDIGTGLARLGSLIIAFGEATMEVFHDIGNPTGSPLESLPDKFQRVGLGSTIVTNYRHYYATLGQRIYWVSSNPRGVYSYDGSRVEKVSSLGIDKILTQRQHYSVSPISIQGQSGIVIAIDSPDTATSRMLLFFPDWKDWFEWTSPRFQGVTSQRLPNVLLGGGDDSEFLFNIDESSNNYQDQSIDYTMSLQFRLPTVGNHMKRMSMCGVVGDTARSASSLNVSWSNDDYQNFSTARTIDLTKETKMLQTCGAYRNRVIKLEHTGNLNCRLEKFIARID